MFELVEYNVRCKLVLCKCEELNYFISVNVGHCYTLQYVKHAYSDQYEDNSDVSAKLIKCVKKYVDIKKHFKQIPGGGACPRTP